MLLHNINMNINSSITIRGNKGHAVSTRFSLGVENEQAEAGRDS